MEKLTKENIKEWMYQRKIFKLPHPPLIYLYYAHLWILARYHEDCDSIVFTEKTIMQWSPTKLTWYQIGELATESPTFTMQGWHTIALFEFPEIPAYDELIKLNEERNAY